VILVYQPQSFVELFLSLLFVIVIIFVINAWSFLNYSKKINIQLPTNISSLLPTDLFWFRERGNIRSSCAILRDKTCAFYLSLTSKLEASKFSVNHVVFVYNEHLLRIFESTLENRSYNRDFNSMCSPEIIDDGEKNHLILRLKSLFLHPPTTKFANTMLMYHGCSHRAARSICIGGARDFRRTDGGFFGAGCYVTSFPEYAADYSSMGDPDENGDYVMLACITSIAMTYPLSRNTDYEQNCNISKFHFMYNGVANDMRSDKALMPGFDSHFMCVSRNNGYQCIHPNDPQCHFDELVVREEALLPFALIYFKKFV